MNISKIKIAKTLSKIVKESGFRKNESEYKLIQF
jgi:hypothetical protein